MVGNSCSFGGRFVEIVLYWGRLFGVTALSRWLFTHCRGRWGGVGVLVLVGPAPAFLLFILSVVLACLHGRLNGILRSSLWFGHFGFGHWLRLDVLIHIVLLVLWQQSDFVRVFV